MKELFFYTDKKLCICSWGKSISELTGRPASSVIGKKYYDFFPRFLIDNKDALLQAMKKRKTVTLKKYSFHCLFCCMNADIKIKPINSPGGKNEAIKVVIQPETTCAVAMKLQQSKKLIDIGKIASTLAHGVRNPLNAIKGAVVYLREKYVGEDTLVEFTKIMEDEISRLEEFISKFLSSSVSETAVTEMDINSLLKKIEVFTSLQLYTRNIQSSYEFGNIPPITINSFYLEQAILNVINNAIEAMNSGGRLIIRTSTEELSDKRFVVITVTDTGPGISDKKPGPFLLEGKPDGRGFGLFITCEILKHYGGHLTIDSKEHVGTTIKLYIPCNAPLRVP